MRECKKATRFCEKLKNPSDFFSKLKWKVQLLKVLAERRWAIDLVMKLCSCWFWMDENDDGVCVTVSVVVTLQLSISEDFGIVFGELSMSMIK